jgi:ornithine cyclodeaminase/alanine dehydrogenase-like protein (mu-crystallin family)
LLYFAVTKTLAAAEGRVLALLGSGVQAKAHLEAIVISGRYKR